MEEYVHNLLNKITASAILLNGKITHPNVPGGGFTHDDLAKNLNITPKEMNILVLIEKNGRLSMKEVTKELAIKKPNVTRFINKMIQKNLVERAESDSGDKRLVYLQMTDFAKKVLTERNELLLSHVERQVNGHLNENTRKELYNAFCSIENILSTFD